MHVRYTNRRRWLRKAAPQVTLIAAIVSALGVATGEEGQSQNEETGHIVGTILDGNRDSPLADVRVAIGERVIFTDSDGRFVFWETAPGAYTLHGARAGYGALRLLGRILAGSEGIPLTVQPGETVTRLLRMFPAAAVAGRTIDEYGEAVRDVLVTPFQLTYDDLGERSIHEYDSVTTNDLGEFRFHSLQPGEYGFRFEPRPARLDRTGRRASIYPSYYPGHTDASMAQFTRLPSGMEVRLKDVLLPAAAGHNLRIRAIMPDGQPLTDAWTVFVRGRGSKSTLRWGRLAAGERAEIAELPTGTYEIDAIAPSRRGHTFVNVFGQDIEANIVVYRNVTVTGQAILESTADVPPTPVTGIGIELVDRSPVPSQAVTPRRSGTSDAQGGFVIPGVPHGRHTISVIDLPADIYLVAVKDGLRNLLGEGLQTDTANLDVTVTLARRAAKIRGVVTGTDGEPLPWAKVVVAPENRSENHRFATTTADEYGRFRFDSLAPGDYRMYAWNELEGAAYLNRNFMQRYDALGILLRLEPDTEITVTVSAVAL